MENALCPICGRTHSTGVIIGQRFYTEQRASEIEEALVQPGHYQFCESCTELTKEYFGLVEIDEKLTVDNNPFRTGQIAWIRPSLAMQLFNGASFREMSRKKWMYANQEIMTLVKELQQGHDGESSAENEEHG